MPSKIHKNYELVLGFVFHYYHQGEITYFFAQLFVLFPKTCCSLQQALLSALGSTQKNANFS